MNKGIFNSERFQNDLKKYKLIIEKVENKDEKDEIQKMLNELLLNVKRMDNMYLDLVYSNQLSSIGSEMREKITDLRKKIESRISKIQI